MPEGVLRVPLDFIELPVSFDSPSAGVGALAAGGEALLTVAVGLLAGFAGAVTADSTDFLFALATAPGTFLVPFGDFVGKLDREPGAIDSALAATLGVGLTTAAWGWARFAVLTTLAIARVADFTILRTEDFLATEEVAATLPFAVDLIAGFFTDCLDTAFCTRVAVVEGFELAFLDCAGGETLATFLGALSKGLESLPPAVFVVTLGSVALLLVATFGLAADLPAVTFGWTLTGLAITLPAADLPFTTAALAAVALRAGATTLVDFELVAALVGTLIDREEADFAGDEATFFLTGAAVLAFDLIDVTEVFDFAATLSPSLLDCLSHGGRVL